MMYETTTRRCPGSNICARFEAYHDQHGCDPHGKLFNLSALLATFVLAPALDTIWAALGKGS